MMNRIALLESEEEKIRKKIELTQKKATDIMSNKEHNEQRQIEKFKQEQDIQAQLEEQRRRNIKMKEQIKRDMEVRQWEIQQKVIQMAQLGK